MSAVKHVVLVAFKPGTTEKQIEGFFKELRGMQKVIPGILDYMDGPYSSPEGLNKNFTHGLIITFKDAAARNVYLPHPEHERVKTLILPHVADVIAFDFEVK